MINTDFKSDLLFYSTINKANDVKQYANIPW